MLKVSALSKKTNDVTNVETCGAPRRLSCIAVEEEQADTKKKDGCLCPGLLSEKHGSYSRKATSASFEVAVLNWIQIKGLSNRTSKAVFKSGSHLVPAVLH